MKDDDELPHAPVALWEWECEEFPELDLLREITILINTHRGSAVVYNLAAALNRILNDKRL